MWPADKHRAKADLASEGSQPGPPALSNRLTPQEEGKGRLCFLHSLQRGSSFIFFVCVCVSLFLLKNIVKKTLQVWFPRWRPRAVDAQSTSKSLANVAQPQTPGLSLTSSAWSQTLSKSHRSLLETESSLLPLLIPDHKHPLTRIF